MNLSITLDESIYAKTKQEWIEYFETCIRCGHPLFYDEFGKRLESIHKTILRLLNDLPEKVVPKLNEIYRKVKFNEIYESRIFYFPDHSLEKMLREIDEKK